MIPNQKNPPGHLVPLEPSPYALPLSFTLRAAKDKRACKDGWDRFLAVSKMEYPLDQDFPISPLKVWRKTGNLSDALWTLQCIQNTAETEHCLRLMAAEFAQWAVDNFWTDQADSRPQNALDAARKFACRESSSAELERAWRAVEEAKMASKTVAWDTARAVAWVTAPRVAAATAARNAASATADAAAWLTTTWTATTESTEATHKQMGLVFEKYLLKI